MERTDRTFEVVEFPSEGARLGGRLYRSRDPRPAAVVVIVHGTSATITMVTDRYAEVFQDAGLAVFSTIIGTSATAAASHVRRSTPGFRLADTATQ